MAAVRQRDTDPELALRRALFAAGVRGWRCHYRRAPGRPDLAWPALHVAVFVDGAFWHGHPSRHRPGRSGKYWDQKIAGNVARDRRVDQELRARGWTVLRIWDFEVRRSVESAVDRVREALVERIRADACPTAWQANLLQSNPEPVARRVAKCADVDAPTTSQGSSARTRPSPR